MTGFHHIDTGDGPVTGSNRNLVELAALLCTPRSTAAIRRNPNARIPSHYIAPRRAACLLSMAA